MRKSLRPSIILFTASALVLPAFLATPALAAPALPTLVVNEIDASGDPQDWIELKNTGTDAVDASGLILRDEKDSSTFTIPSDTTIAAGAYATFDVGVDFGLGRGADSARLFTTDGTTLIDGFAWTSDAAPATWGRCADGTGEFAVTNSRTKGTANDCDVTTPTPPVGIAWPGGAGVSTSNIQNYFGTNLSGLSYESGTGGAADTLWAVKNGPGTLYRLQQSGTDWVAATDNGWGSGKTLHYVDGTGDVDAEGVVHTDAGIFVSSERDNSNNGVSRPAVLRYDASSTDVSLSASIEWNLVSDLPVVDANLGLEAITLVPDSYLVSKGFVDEVTGLAYNPASYANHGTGLFFVGLEGTGSIYAYALDQTDGTKFTRVATIVSGFPSIMELQFDPEKQAIWAVCDNTCDGQFALLDPAKSGSDAGHFVVTSVYNRPANMGNLNNEGFVTAPQTLCIDGVKPVYFADDDQDAGYSLRTGTISCVAAASTDPTPVDESQLRDDTRGPVTVPAGAFADSTISVSAGEANAGAVVDVWLHSTPVHLLRATVSPEGTLQVSIPASAPVGAHRIAVVAANGSLIGWANITVVAALVDGGEIADTGAAPSGVLAFALLLLLAGAATVTLRRRGQHTRAQLPRHS
jgi:hypothetical protein